MTRALDDEPGSVAIVRPRTGLGDLLCTVPALRALRARLPAARIVMVTFAEMRPVVDRMAGLVDDLLAFPGYPGIPEGRPRLQALPAFLTAAREQRFDLALQMYGANRAADALTARLGARRTGGFLAPGRRPADRATQLPYPLHRPEVWRHLDLMALLGAPPCGEELCFPVRAEDERAACRLREAAGLDGPYALLHPGATSPSRRWPPQRFAAVGDALAQRGLRIALTGVASEAGLSRAVRAAMRATAADLAGRTSLGSLAALLRGARLLVSNDTGTARLGAALGVPSVTVFLSGEVERWAPPDRRRHRIARVPVGCNPCPHLSCPIDHRCARRLTVRAVLAEVDALLRI